MSRNSKNINAGWFKLLNPALLKSNLINASLYLAAWELFCDSVIVQLKKNYQMGLDEKDARFLSKYESEVISLDPKGKKSPLHASLMWLCQNGAINSVEHDLANKILHHRNEITHELPEFVASVKEIDLDLLNAIVKLTTKIDKWWIREFAIPANPDFDNTEIDDSEISSGRMLILSLMFNIATGDDENIADARKEFDDLFEK
ncbi:hypothetical protein [Gimesia maris]|nr:hypothetical protein [Gimesia maris]EDL61217.1 hypothetical protein PM8797T_03279 [Gimesia maris DSM 8797]QGQ30813.1 hypothetical protein F1729_20395 [Gimesia maris]